MPKPLKVEFSPTALFELEDIADYMRRTIRTSASTVIYRVEEKRLLVLTVVEGHRRLRGLPSG